MKLNSLLLASAAAALPLTAMALTLPVAEDTSTSTNLKVAKVAGKATTLPVLATRSALVRFGVSSFSGVIPAANVTSARMVIYIGAAKKPGDLRLHRVTADWSEVFVAPLAIPTVDPSALQTIATADVIAKQFVVLDVTSTVKAWLDGSAPDYGFAIQASGLTNVLLGSKEGSGVGYPATLEIDTAIPFADGSVGTLQLANGGVTMVKIADGAVGNTQLAADLTLAGTTRGTFNGDLTGNVSGTSAGFTGSLAGEVTGTQSATAIADTVVTGKLLTGLTSAPGILAATDSILGAFGKLDGNIALNAPLASPSFTGTVTFPAGTATVPALRLQTGVNLTTPLFGAVEFDGTNLFLTNNSGTPTRKTIAFTDSAITNAQIPANLTLGGTTTGTFSGTSSLTTVGTLTGGATGAGFTINLGTSTVSGTLANANTSATNANTASAIVARDASGGFSAGAISAEALNLPTTSGGSVGVINQNGSRILHSFGTNNFFAGPFAGNFATTAQNNSGVGVNALTSLTTGSANTAFGSNALGSVTAGAQNTAVGLLALGSNTLGGQNVAIGNQALGNNTVATQNTAIGGFALLTQSFSNSGAAWPSENTAVGYLALRLNQPTSTTTGHQNTAIGSAALSNNTLGSLNAAVGRFALFGNTTASQNTALGWGALSTQSFDNAGVQWASNNTAIGYRALFANQPTTTSDGVFNTAVGAFALQANTTGLGNTAVGNTALLSNTTGISNTALGRTALSANTTGSSNTGLGSTALAGNTTGANNTAVGNAALQQNSIGASNTALGAQALQSNTTAGANVAIGNLALNAQSFSNSATAWASSNTAVGANALQSNQPTSTSNGNNNVAIGTSALLGNTIGSGNTAVGVGAIAANTVGTGNIAVGLQALANSTSNNNTALGVQALQSVSTGVGNIAIGYQSGALLTTGGNNIAIGHVGVAAEANTIRIGTSGTQTRAFVTGIRGITTGVNDAVTVVIDSNGQLGTVSSSRRYKEDILDMGDISVRLGALRPVTFRYKQPYADGGKPVQFGLIAEEVAEVFPELCVRNADGLPETVKYQDLTPLLLNEVQKLTREKAAMRDELDALKARLDRLEQSRDPAK